MKKEEFLKENYVDRCGSGCYKWDILEEKYGEKDLVSMWVADMDFKAPKETIEAIQKKAEFGVFGYSLVSKEYYNSFIEWEKTQHNCEIEKEWIRFSPGVVTGIFWCVKMLTQENDSIIINMPVYYPFHDAIRNLGRKLISNELVNNNGIYSIDFEDFEKKIKENNVKLFILCSPHNPVGRVWTEEELEKLFVICEKYDVKIVSDEIHHDLLIGSNKHIPSFNVANGKYSNRIIMLTSASKTFNLAGMKNSFIIIKNKELLSEFDKFEKTVHEDTGNMLGYTAVEAAYKYGKNWYDMIMEIITDNYNYLKERIEKELPKAILSPLEGTYLAWLDLSNYVGKIEEKEMKEYVQTKAKIAVDYGNWFGDGGKGFIRLNLATSPELVKKAVDGLVKAFNN